MVHFRSTATFLATALSIAHSALGGGTPPTDSGTAPTFTVLTGNFEMACSPEQVAALTTDLTEAVTLAKAASSTLLNTRDIGKSRVYKTWLGNADPKKMEAQHYAPVTSIQLPLKPVTSDDGHKPGMKATAPAHETLIQCFPESNEKCTKNGKSTRNAASTSKKEQTISLCPVFFGNVPVYDPQTKKDVIVRHLSLADGTAVLLENPTVYDRLGGFDLLHEMQHLRPVIGEHTVRDLYIKADAPSEVVPKPNDVSTLPKGIVGAYTKQRCIALPEDQKCLNAQNLAYFALNAYSQSRAKSDGATSDASKVSKDVTKTPKRFEAIHQRRAGKAAETSSGA